MIESLVKTMKGNKGVVFASALMLTLVLTASVANAMYVGIVVGGGKVSVSYTVTAHLTGVPEDVIGWFKHLNTLYYVLKPTIDYNLQQMLQDWLRTNMGQQTATIEYLTCYFLLNFVRKRLSSS